MSDIHRAASFSSALGKLLEQLNPIYAGDRPRLFLLGLGLLVPFRKFYPDALP